MMRAASRFAFAGICGRRSRRDASPTSDAILIAALHICARTAKCKRALFIQRYGSAVIFILIDMFRL